jgi:glucosylceramidase
MACSNDNDPQYEPPKSPDPEPNGEIVGSVEFWETTGDESSLLLEKEALDSYDTPQQAAYSISINPEEQYQEIEGFGAALTGSSAYLINELSNTAKIELLTDLFDVEDGIGLSYMRMTIGASDFSLEDFTYNDLPNGEEDTLLSQFSIEKDQAHVIPVFQDILSIYPDLKIMGSPWSAPAWMKDNSSLYGGKLRPKWYDTYANYFVKYIEAYGENGIVIDAITPQNEPLHEAGYPTMRMEAEAQAEFIGNHLGPVMEENSIGTKIIAYDHNFDRPDYPRTILEDPIAAQYVAGSAFHAYAGEASAMSTIHNEFPDKGLYFTEISGGEWATDFGDNLVWNIKNIFIGTTKNWSKNVLLWNLALDENFGPTNNGCSDCRGVVTIPSSGEIQKNVEYYALAHFSKFVRPGAKRIASTEAESGSGLFNVAFSNPDGKIALIILNESDSAREIAVDFPGESFVVSMKPKSVTSLTWN